MLRITAHQLASLLIAIILLQFTAANIGEHQLHLSQHTGSEDSHPHLQYSTEVTTLAQCDGGDCNDTSANPAIHNHVITETQMLDLCLDCQCHGGSAALVSFVSIVPSVPVTDLQTNLDAQYLPPESLPAYRPPIA